MKEIPLTKGFVAKVSDGDYAYLRQFKWWTSTRGPHKDVYAMGCPHGKLVYMHRFIAERIGKSLDHMIDHWDGDRLNNMRRNLREATKIENGRNRHCQPYGISKVRGVYNNNGRWSARITVNYKTIYLGTYATIAEAAAVRKKAEKKHFGRFAP